MPKYRIVIAKGEMNPFTKEYPKGHEEKDGEFEAPIEALARNDALKWIRQDKTLKGYKIIKVEVLE